ncbi:MAG: protein phosphatase CheZ [Stenotrophobium sp.]
MTATAANPRSVPDRAETLTRLRGLVCALEDGDDALFEQGMTQLLRLREESLLVNVARITRNLHRTVNEMSSDSRLEQYVTAEMPDACKRLDYVVKLTEDAAHHTLDLVDRSRDLAGNVRAAGHQLLRVQDQVMVVIPDTPAALSLSAQLLLLHKSVMDNADQLSGTLSALSQAQEYQDLTGQVIKRVIKLVRDVETALIELLRAAGLGNGNATRAAVAPVLAGPAVPGVNEAANQSDADALLADLGF